VSSISAASPACGVTQPKLSGGVKQIEKQMGVLLVNRGSRFRGFTPEGEKILEWARRIVEPEAVHTIGLVVPAREPMTPLSVALVAEAKRLARTLDPAIEAA
jgi:hypothetical protein